MSSALASLGPGVIFARDFRIVRALAEGGMGAVFVVEQLSSGKLRALKVLSPSLVADPASREQFTLEARIGGQIGSGHIVEVIAAGVDEETDIPYLAMEFLEGEDLADLLHRRGRLPTHEAMEIFEQLGDALAAAHRAGVIHRDIKPRNIFVARSRLRGMPFVVKVLDFGISKLITNNATSVTVTRQLGSPLFMAPEQARSGAKLRRSTDVWPMGLLAYLLLTGRHYWRAVESNGVNLNALLMEIAVHPIEPPGLRALEQGLESGVLPEGFDGWFLRCVERDPERRFADAGEATEALGAVMRERHESMMENEPTVVRALPGRRTSGAFPVAPEARSRIGTPVSQPVPPPTTTMPERPASRAPAAIAAIGPPPRGDFSADTRAAPKRPWMVVAAAGVALVVAALWWRHSHRPSANASGIVAYPRGALGEGCRCRAVDRCRGSDHGRWRADDAAHGALDRRRRDDARRERGRCARARGGDPRGATGDGSVDRRSGSAAMRSERRWARRGAVAGVQSGGVCGRAPGEVPAARRESDAAPGARAGGARDRGDLPGGVRLLRGVLGQEAGFGDEVPIATEVLCRVERGVGSE